MARCGCSGAQPCSCFIEAGAGITVEGSGSASTPFVISVDSSSTTVLDTPTINMGITGSGTSGDPYIIFGSVKLDPSVDNLLAATANGLFLDCSAISACLVGAGFTEVTDTSSIDMSISGTGTGGDPYVLSAVIVLDPDTENAATVTGAGVYVPQIRTGGFSDSDTVTLGGTFTTPTVVATATLTITNLSPNYTATALVIVDADPDIDLVAGERYTLSIQGDVTQDYTNPGIGGVLSTGWQCNRAELVTVPPSGILMFTAPIVADNFGGTSIIQEVRWRTNAILVAAL